MDGSGFDNLTRSLANVSSRRRFVAGLLGSTLGLAGLRGASAASCKTVGHVCREDVNCCSGLCGPKDRTGRRKCACPAGQEEKKGKCVDPTTSYLADVENCGAKGNKCRGTTCQSAVCVNGVCGLTANSRAVGKPCDNGKAWTTKDVCQADGSCAGTLSPCDPLDQCHEPGVRDGETGNCSYQPKQDGSPCNDGNACTQTDTCQAGKCEGSNPVVCTTDDSCLVAGTCDPQTGRCSTSPKPNGTPCSDDNACTDTDTCQGGTCTPGTDVVCDEPTQCQVEGSGVCDPATGQCAYTTKGDGAPCETGNPCTDGDTCQAGACVAGEPVVCKAKSPCHEAGTCDPETGQCSEPVKADGAPCDDGDACTQIDVCQAGACVPGTLVVCPDPAPCHEQGSCDPTTGACSTPLSADGSPCGGGTCTTAGTCQAGSCTGGNPVTCTALDDCHVPGVCDPQTGCSNPLAADGTPCDDGNPLCVNGTCCGGEMCPTLGAGRIEEVCCGDGTTCSTMTMQGMTIGACCAESVQACATSFSNGQGAFGCCDGTCQHVDALGGFDFCCPAGRTATPVFIAPGVPSEIRCELACDTELCNVQTDPLSTSLTEICCPANTSCTAVSQITDVGAELCCPAPSPACMTSYSSTAPTYGCCSGSCHHVDLGTGFDFCCPAGQEPLTGVDSSGNATVTCQEGCSTGSCGDVCATELCYPVSATGSIATEPICCPTGTSCVQPPQLASYPKIGNVEVGVCCAADAPVCMTSFSLSGQTYGCCNGACHHVDLGPGFDFCCPAGQEPRAGFDSSGNPTITCHVVCETELCYPMTANPAASEPICCPAGTSCVQPSGLSGGEYPFGEVGVCCVDAAHACLTSFSLSGSTYGCCNGACHHVDLGGGFDYCCPAGQEPRTGIDSSGNVTVTCHDACETELCIPLTTAGMAGIEPICCPTGTSCMQPAQFPDQDLPFGEVGVCCGEGQEARLTFGPNVTPVVKCQDTCETELCYGLSVMLGGGDPVCCPSGTSCLTPAGIGGFSIPFFDGKVGTCCDSASNVCQSLFSMNPGDAACCSGGCQSISGLGSGVTFCCPDGSVPVIDALTAQPGCVNTTNQCPVSFGGIGLQSWQDCPDGTTCSTVHVQSIIVNAVAGACCPAGESIAFANGGFGCCPNNRRCGSVMGVPVCCGDGQSCVGGTCQAIANPPTCGGGQQLAYNRDTAVICCDSDQICNSNGTGYCCAAGSSCQQISLCPPGIANCPFQPIETCKPDCPAGQGFALDPATRAGVCCDADQLCDALGLPGFPLCCPDQASCGDSTCLMQGFNPFDLLDPSALNNPYAFPFSFS